MPGRDDIDPTLLVFIPAFADRAPALRSGAASLAVNEPSVYTDASLYTGSLVSKSNSALFVDGAYFSRCWDAVSSGSRLDWMRFLDVLERDAGSSVGASYYFDATADITAAQANSYYNFLQVARPDGPGFRLVLGSLQERELFWPARLGGKPVLHPDYGDPFIQRSQKEVDVLLAFNLLRSQTKVGWRKLYLVAGDKDFFEVVRHLVENEGVDVSVFGLRRETLGNATVASKYGPFARHIYFEDIAHQMAASTNN